MRYKENPHGHLCCNYVACGMASKPLLGKNDISYTNFLDKQVQTCLTLEEQFKTLTAITSPHTVQMLNSIKVQGGEKKLQEIITPLKKNYLDESFFRYLKRVGIADFGYIFDEKATRFFEKIIASDMNEAKQKLFQDVINNLQSRNFVSVLTATNEVYDNIYDKISSKADKEKFLALLQDYATEKSSSSVVLLEP